MVFPLLYRASPSASVAYEFSDGLDRDWWDNAPARTYADRINRHVSPCTGFPNSW